MKIKLYRDIKDVGEADEVVDVEAVLGNQIVCRGLGQVLAHDPPPPDAPVSVIAERPLPPPKPSRILDSHGDLADGTATQEKETDEDPDEEDDE